MARSYGKVLKVLVRKMQIKAILKIIHFSPMIGKSPTVRQCVSVCCGAVGTLPQVVPGKALLGAICHHPAPASEFT